MIDLACHDQGIAPEITRINPDQLHEPPGYHHVTIVEAGRAAFLAEQCPLDASGTLVLATSSATVNAARPAAAETRPRVN